MSGPAKNVFFEKYLILIDVAFIISLTLLLYVCAVNDYTDMVLVQIPCHRSH